MPIWSRQWPFLDYSVQASPLDGGVYGLWKDNELIYIGASSEGGSLRACLVERFSEFPYPEVDHYSWEVSDDPKKRMAQVLEQHQRTYGRSPKLNSQLSGDS
jgi:hypothetical protein